MTRKTVLTSTSIISALCIPSAIYLVGKNRDERVKQLLAPISKPETRFKYAEHVNLYKKALQNDPNNDSLKLHLATSLVNTGRFKEATPIFKYLEKSSDKLCSETSIAFLRPGVYEKIYAEGKRLDKEMEETLKKEKVTNL
jgi:tetratricopeptide (TPR) repeat protein